nr:hypothetical protein [Clostridia bacterium]
GHMSGHVPDQVSGGLFFLTVPRYSIVFQNSLKFRPVTPRHAKGNTDLTLFPAARKHEQQ